MIQRWLLASFLLLSTAAYALIPPLDPAELTADAHVIISARVVSVAKSGKVVRDHCYGWQHYRAQIEVLKASKGEPPATIEVRFRDRVEDKKGCVGGADAYSLTEGALHTMYLRQTDKDGETWFGFWHRQCLAAPEPVSEPQAP